MENVDGIAGKLVNDNYKEIEALKSSARDNGIEVSKLPPPISGLISN